MNATNATANNMSMDVFAAKLAAVAPHAASTAAAAVAAAHWAAPRTTHDDSCVPGTQELLEAAIAASDPVEVAILATCPHGYVRVAVAGRATQNVLEALISDPWASVRRRVAARLDTTSPAWAVLCRQEGHPDVVPMLARRDPGAFPGHQSALEALAMWGRGGTTEEVSRWAW